MDEDRYYSDNLAEPAPSDVNTDLDSERAVLCLLMKHEKALEGCSQKLTKDDFFDKRNQTIYESILSLYMESKSIDRYTIGDALDEKGKTALAGGREYLYGVADMVAVLSNLDTYIDSVREKSYLRSLTAVFNKYLTQAKSGKTDADSIINGAVSELSSMKAEDTGVGFEKLDKILRDNFNNIKEVSSGRGAKLTYTGFNMLDKKMGGMAPGSLNIIAARPGVGKTAFALNIATNVATMTGGNVNIFSLEMGKAELGNRILAARTKTTSRELQQANLSEEKQREVLKAIKVLQDLNIYVDDNSNVTPVTIMGKLKELKANGKLGLVIIDYIGLMNADSGGSSGNRQFEIAEISRSLKKMAKEMQIPIIVLCQLSRGAEKRDDHTPMLSDLRDSGAIEQDADTVIFIDRQYYNKGEEMPEIMDATIYLSKNRKGETGKIKMKWWGAKTKFFEPDKNSDPQDPMNGEGGSSVPPSYPGGGNGGNGDSSSGGSGNAKTRESSYTRTQDRGSASSDFSFGEDAPWDDNGSDIDRDLDDNNYASDDDQDGYNPENEDFFNDSHDDLPPGFLSDD